MESFFCEAPESFQAVDVVVSFCVGKLFVDFVVFPILLQAFVAFEAVGVVD